MKKFFAFLMIAAMASTLCAADEIYSQFFFNRNQFQAYNGTVGDYQLTVPFAYEGTISLSGYQAYDDDVNSTEGKIQAENDDNNSKTYGYDDCVVESVRGNIPVFMTMCQACMDCFPCSEMFQKELADTNPITIEAVGTNSVSGYLTRWNLYLISDDGEYADIYKYNLINSYDNAGEADSSVFYTGRKKENAYIQVVSEYGNFTLTGKKADYTFRYYNAVLAGTTPTWTQKSTDLATAYIKSVASFEGKYCLAVLLGVHQDWKDLSEKLAAATTPAGYAVVKNDFPNLFGFQLCGTMNLSRNTSVTEMLLSKAYGVKAVEKADEGSWENCSTPDVLSTNWCEKVILGDDSTTDEFDNWLKGTKYKSRTSADFAKGDLNGLANVLNEMVLDYPDTAKGTKTVW